jgi:cellulose synthase/poly-beta-1,6-N-acetylglucosamine synthase-like glycosyltransferase
VNLIVSERQTGKSMGINRLMEEVKYPLVLFTDANVRLDLDALKVIREVFSDPSVACVSGSVVYESNSNVSTAKTWLQYWKFEENLRQLESDTGSVITALGAIFAIRTGMFSPVPKHLSDDFYTPIRILCQGGKVIREPKLICRKIAINKRKEQYYRRVRIVSRGFSGHLHLWKEIKGLSAWNLYKYVSHKVIRWMSIFLLMGSFTLALATAVAFGFGPLVFGIALFAAFVLLFGYACRVPVIGMVAEALIVFSAAGVGVLHSLWGKPFASWSVSKSKR